MIPFVSSYMKPGRWPSTYRFIMFQMGLMFKIGDDSEKMQPGDKVTFGSLNVISNQLRISRLQEFKPPMWEE